LTTSSAPAGLKKYLPVLSWLPGYQSSWLRLDLVAGLSAAAVVIPQAMAYATMAGLPIQVGLYVALAPMFVYALLGSSRRLSVSSTSAISIFTGTIMFNVVGPVSNPSDYIIPAATLAFFVGVFLILAALLRLGFLADFISKPVLTGILSGIGVVIIISQLGKVLGLSVPSGSSNLETLEIIFTGLNQINWPTALLAAVTLAIVIFLPRLMPRIPAALVAVAFGIVLSAIFDLGQLGIALVGDIPIGLPSVSLPDLSLVSGLWLPAAAIAVLTFTESISVARAFRKFGEPAVNANQELIALGMANIAGGFFQAYPASGGTSQTAVNARAGAKTQVAALVTVGVVILILLFLAPLIELMPEATLGAILLVAGAGLIDVAEFRNMAQLRRSEFILALIAFVVVIVAGILVGVVVSVLLSIVALIAQVEHPPVYALGRKPGSNEYRLLSDHPDDETFAGMLMVRTEGRLFFANTSGVIDDLWALIHQASPRPRVVVLSCDAIPDIDYTAIELLAEFGEQLNNAGILLWLTTLNPKALHNVRQAMLLKNVSGEAMYPNLGQAIEAYLQRYEPEQSNE
jgi:high affinity sulfate transporter 1